MTCTRVMPRWTPAVWSEVSSFILRLRPGMDAAKVGIPPAKVTYMQAPKPRKPPASTEETKIQLLGRSPSVRPKSLSALIVSCGVLTLLTLRGPGGVCFTSGFAISLRAATSGSPALTKSSSFRNYKSSLDSTPKVYNIDTDLSSPSTFATCCFNSTFSIYIAGFYSLENFLAVCQNCFVNYIIK